MHPAAKSFNRLQILKNVFIICTGVLLLFTAYDGLTMLQSTMNREGGIGVWSQAIMYFFFSISAIFFPKYVIKKYGTKTTYALSMLAYIPYIASNFYSHWVLVIPVSILIGLGAALIWGAQASYLNNVSEMYVDIDMNSKGRIASEKNISIIYNNNQQSNIDKRDYRGVSFDLESFKNDKNRVTFQSCDNFRQKSNSVTFVPKSETETFSNTQRCFIDKHQTTVNDQLKSQDNFSLYTNNVAFLPKSGTEISTNINTQEGSMDKHKPNIKNQFCSVPSRHDVFYSHKTNHQNASENSSNINAPQCFIDIHKPDINDQFCSVSLRHDNETNRQCVPMSNKAAEVAAIEHGLKKRRKMIESTTARFFGFHGVAYLTCHLWGNLITYFILQTDVDVDALANSTCVCGAHFCNVASACFEQNIVQPSDQIRYVLTGTCVCIGIIAVLIVVFFLDPLEQEKEEVAFTMDLLMATYKLAKKKELILLIPASFYIGMVQGFYTGDFTKSFVGCAWGTYHVGLVAASYGALCGASSFSAGWLVKRVGRIPIISAASLVNIAACVLMLAWRPTAQEPALFFVIAGMWGVHVGAVWSQLRAFYGILFKADEEAAFAAFHVWYALGFSLSFAYSNYFCTYVKIYVLMAVCALGFVGYLTVELLHFKNKNTK